MNSDLTLMRVLEDKTRTRGTMPAKDASLTGDRNEARIVSTTMLSMKSSNFIWRCNHSPGTGRNGVISWALIAREASNMDTVPHVETNPFFSTAMRHDATRYYVTLRFLDPRYD